MGDLLTIMAVALFAFIGGIAAGANQIRTQAVEHQCASHDMVTGEWRWKDERDDD